MNGSAKPLTMAQAKGVSTRARSSPGWLLVVAWFLASAYVYRQSIWSLVDLAFRDDTVSYVLVVPAICGYLAYIGRERLSARKFEPLLSIPLLLLALLTSVSSGSGSMSSSSRLSLLVLSLVFFLEAGFVALLGRKLTRESWFTLGFLFFTVPLPQSITSRLTQTLQSASAAVVELLFNASGVPVLRQGLVFHLSRVNIEIAQECSGVRSSLALLLLAVLISHFAFGRFWKKAAFLAAGLLMMVLKNGVRIVTLTLLANYVNPEFLYGRLHHEGGVVFFLFGLLLLLPVYILLRRGENRQGSLGQSLVATP